MFATYRKDDRFHRPLSRHRTLYGATQKAGKTLGVGLLIPGHNCRSHRDPIPVFTVESDDSASTVPYFGPCVGEPSEYCRDESVLPLGR